MIENYIVSYVIMPHGITDLTRVKVNELPLLFLIYILSLGTCVFMHEILHYGHIILFLVSSISFNLIGPIIPNTNILNKIKIISFLFILIL